MRHEPPGGLTTAASRWPSTRPIKWPRSRAIQTAGDARTQRQREPRSARTGPTARATSYVTYVVWGSPRRVAQNERERRSTIDRCTTRHSSYRQSQRRRKLVAEVFGWIKTFGAGSKLRYPGRAQNKL